MEAERNGGGHLGRRCSMCGITWPPQYLRCYQCGDSIADELGQADTPPIPSDEARSMMRHWKFEQFLKETGRE